MRAICIIINVVRSLVRDRAELAVENLALRQQLAVLERQTKRPRLKHRDRVFWTLLSKCWSNWRSALLIVQPATDVHFLAGSWHWGANRCLCMLSDVKSDARKPLKTQRLMRFGE